MRTLRLITSKSLQLCRVLFTAAPHHLPLSAVQSPGDTCQYGDCWYPRKILRWTRRESEQDLAEWQMTLNPSQNAELLAKAAE